MTKNQKIDAILLERLGFTNPHETGWIFSVSNMFIFSEVHYFEIKKNGNVCSSYVLLPAIVLN